ncbi:zinc-binding dehydrogenase [Kitasatospora purpeofusca]|uniref:zinc-binding dehydrogenase n=1 Tax=Kitasatospora purpeofusca TaxID=67352 RepID=UPI0036D27719
MASSEEKRRTAVGLGADATVDSSTTDALTERILDAAGGPVSAALEMTGGDVFHATLAALSPRGRMSVFGAVTGSEGLVPITSLLAASKAVSGFWLPSASTSPAHTSRTRWPRCSRRSPRAGSNRSTARSTSSAGPVRPTTTSRPVSPPTRSSLTPPADRPLTHTSRAPAPDGRTCCSKVSRYSSGFQSMASMSISCSAVVGSWPLNAVLLSGSSGLSVCGSRPSSLQCMVCSCSIPATELSAVRYSLPRMLNVHPLKKSNLGDSADNVIETYTVDASAQLADGTGSGCRTCTAATRAASTAGSSSSDRLPTRVIRPAHLAGRITSCRYGAVRRRTVSAPLEPAVTAVEPNCPGRPTARTAKNVTVPEPWPGARPARRGDRRASPDAGDRADVISYAVLSRCRDRVPLATSRGTVRRTDLPHKGLTS